MDRVDRAGYPQSGVNLFVGRMQFPGQQPHPATQRSGAQQTCQLPPHGLTVGGIRPGWSNHLDPPGINAGAPPSSYPKPPYQNRDCHDGHDGEDDEGARCRPQSGQLGADSIQEFSLGCRWVE